MVVIIEMVETRNALLRELKGMLYGSVEIRERDSKKYIYLHQREDGLSTTKYLGDYTDDLYALIIKNNLRAKEIKKELKRIEKELSLSGYIECEIEEKVARNIDFARKHMVDTIYKQAVLEGIATTYADTETIIDGGKVSGMAVNDIMKVVNLKHAWEFVLSKYVITAPTNFALLCETNRLIEEGFYYNAGKVRLTPVSIGGTTWKPSVPNESDVKEELQTILDSDIDTLDKAVELLLYVMKRQIFIDGNKRTAVVFANHLLISKGLGLIVIPSELVEEYKGLLISYYEGRDEKAIKTFLKNKCYIAL